MLLDTIVITALVRSLWRELREYKELAKSRLEQHPNQVLKATPDKISEFMILAKEKLLKIWHFNLLKRIIGFVPLRLRKTGLAMLTGVAFVEHVRGFTGNLVKTVITADSGITPESRKTLKKGLIQEAIQGGIEDAEDVDPLTSNDACVNKTPNTFKEVIITTALGLALFKDTKAIATAYSSKYPVIAGKMRRLDIVSGTEKLVAKVPASFVKAVPFTLTMYSICSPPRACRSQSYSYR